MRRHDVGLGSSSAPLCSDAQMSTLLPCLPSMTAGFQVVTLASLSTQVGIYYDKEVQAEAAALVADWTLADMEYMREQVGRVQGLGFEVPLALDAGYASLRGPSAVVGLQAPPPCRSLCMLVAHVPAACSHVALHV